MKKHIGCFIVILTLFFVVAPSIVRANGATGELALVGREIFPGIKSGGVTHGALFVGKVFNVSNQFMGYFSVTIDHDGNGIEDCMSQTTILRFKLVLNLTDLGRLVLVGYPPSATADWYYDDPSCLNGGFCWDDNIPMDVGDLTSCRAGNPEQSLVAVVLPIVLMKQWFGTYGVSFRSINYGLIYGLLIHTPPVFPAVIGYVSLSETMPELP